jgi:phosphoribosylformylglycinamidine synthase
LFIPGGFSAADEPDGSGKFIASILKNSEVKEAVHQLLERNGLILGICNGFQALVQAGLLPYGKITELTENSPILYHNSLHKHIAKMVKIKVTNDSSPWLNGLKDKTYWMPISHGEGRWMEAEETNNLLIKNNQIATQYVDFEGNISFENEHNPNGSMFAIEGIVSPCGKIFGRMGHPERVDTDLFINIPEVEKMPIFKNAVNYFRKNSDS